MLDSFVKDTDLPVAVAALDGGLAVGQAIVVIDLNAVTIGGKNCGLTLQFVILKKTDGNWIINISVSV